MRILQINHQYPPFSRAGSELHCWQLSQSLATTDEVAVFHISGVPRKRPRRLERSAPDGFPVFHGIDGGHYARIADWPNPVLCRQFESVLQEWRPDVVHFHNYLSLGDDLPSVAKRHGSAVVYTLHDFGLICPNHLLLRTDNTLCGKCHGDFFQDCCPVMIRTSGGREPWLRRHIPSLARWRTFASQQSNPVVRALLRAGLVLPRMVYGEPATTQVPRKRDFFLEHTRRIFADVDLFIGPSHYLRDRFITCGLPADKMLHIRYGVGAVAPSPRVPSPDGKLRFGFIGAFHAHKGLQVLVRAFQGLGDLASLHIHGSSFGSPITESHWRSIRQQAPPGIVFHGAYHNDQLGEILSSLDVVVVPSIWFENSPFTIQEAFQAGVPVITSDQGGMAELVRDGVEGLQFRIGDSDDLRRVMRSLIDAPARLDEFRRNMPALPTLEGQAARIRGEYERLLAARAR